MLGQFIKVLIDNRMNMVQVFSNVPKLVSRLTCSALLVAGPVLLYPPEIHMSAILGGTNWLSREFSSKDLKISSRMNLLSGTDHMSRTNLYLSPLLLTIEGEIRVRRAQPEPPVIPSPFPSHPDACRPGRLSQTSPCCPLLSVHLKSQCSCDVSD